MRKQKFVIVSIPRTGSNLMVGLLDSHPQIICHYEIFHIKEIYHSSKYGDEFLGDFDVEKRDRKPKKFLKLIWKNTFDKDAKAVGFKIFKEHNEIAINILLKDKNVRKFILKRDLLYSFLSNKEAQQTGKYYLKKGEKEIVIPPKIEFIPGDFKRYEKRMKEFYEYVENTLKQSGQDFLQVHYNDLTDKDEQRRWLEFLKVNPDTGNMEVLFKKQNVRTLEERIENYEATAEFFKGTAYEKHFKK